MCRTRLRANKGYSTKPMWAPSENARCSLFKSLLVRILVDFKRMLSFFLLRCRWRVRCLTTKGAGPKTGQLFCKEHLAAFRSSFVVPIIAKISANAFLILGQFLLLGTDRYIPATYSSFVSYLCCSLYVLSMICQRISETWATSL